MVSPRRRRKPRAFFSLDPKTASLLGVALASALTTIAGSCQTSNKQQAVADDVRGTAEYAVQLEERVSALAERMGNAEGRLARVEKRGGASRGSQADSPRVQRRTEPEKGWRGFLSRWLGNSD